MSRELVVRIEHWPIAGRFTIARGANTEAVVVVAEIETATGSGLRRMRALCPLWRDGGRRGASQSKTWQHGSATASRPPIFNRSCHPAPPATRSIARCGTWRRNARKARLGPRRYQGADCRHHRLHPQHRRAGCHARGGRGRLRPPAPEGQARQTGRCGAHRAVRAGAPNAELIVDANEGWSPENLEPRTSAPARMPA